MIKNVINVVARRGSVGGPTKSFDCAQDDSKMVSEAEPQSYSVKIASPHCVRLVLTAILFLLTVPVASADTTTGLIGYWRLDDGSGLSASDASGSGNIGTLNGNAAWIAGKRSSAVVLDGTGDKIYVPHAAALGTYADLTACAWVNPSSISDYDDMVSKYSGNPGWGFLLSDTGNANSLQLYVDTTGTPGWWVTGTNSVVAGVWQYVCVTYDASSNATVPALYINGVAQSVTAHQTPTGSINIDTASGNLEIGSCCNNNTEDFSGTIDDVRVYNRELTASDIQELYSGGVVRNATIQNGAVNQ